MWTGRCLVISNPDKEDLFLTAQRILHLIEEWSRQHDIEFSPHKMEVMPICFLHGPDDPTLYLYDTPLKIVYFFLYLGTIINSELSWKENFDKRLKSGRKILTRFTAAAGKKWGPSVEMQLWLLDFIIMQHVGF